MDGPVLTTERLILRPVIEDDTDELHRLWTDPQVRRYLWDDVFIPLETAAEVVAVSRESFAGFGFGQWALRRSDDPGAIVGVSGLRHFDDPPDPPPREHVRKVEILYALSPSHWGQGMATEAALAVLGQGFDGCGLERIFAGADPPNVASIRVMGRLGMRPWGRLRINGLDADYYVLERRDWRGD